MTTASQPAPRPLPWILSPAQDLILFIATPVLILPAILGLQGIMTSAALYTIVMAFGAMGHHLPGMMRAYGDRALFQRFRTRFLASPLVLCGLCITAGVLDSDVMLIVAYVWGVWHGWMQTYGFLRIYDAKVGSFARPTVLLDFWMCALWFIGGVVFSDSRIHHVQKMTAGFGIPPIPAEMIGTLRTVWMVLLALVTIGFVINAILQRRAGRSMNPIKIALIATSVAWWWYANVYVTDILLSLVVFEIFHDVQYLAIVWLFNRRRVETDKNVGGFTSFVFRRSWGMMGIYLAMIFIYGGFGPLAEQSLTGTTAIAVAKALIISSTLLHFYFDGFIWKVREPAMQTGFGIVGAAQTRTTPVVTRHGLKWAFLLIPVGILFAMGGREGKSLEYATKLAASTPRSAVALFENGVQLLEHGKPGEAVAAFEKVLEVNPGSQQARENLLVSRIEAGRAAVRNGDDASAKAYLQPIAAEQLQLCRKEVNEGYAAWQKRLYAEAIIHYRTAIVLAPQMPQAHLNLALAYRDSNRIREALQHAQIGARLLPTDTKAAQLVSELRARIRQGR